MATSGPVTFSVIVPTFNRVLNGLLRRTLLSVLNQTYPLWECVVVDDGSTEPVDKVVESIKDSRFKLVTLDKHSERLIAWNAGFRAATGEWICMLCSDDIYLPHFFEVLTQAMKVYPDASVFNFQELNIRDNATVWIRGLFMPKRRDKGHEPFKSGGISTGNFVFKRECLDVVGMFPDTHSFWELANIWRERYPWIREVGRPKGELGNPWGEDYALAYALTREYHSIPLPVVLMCKYPSKARPVKFHPPEKE